MTGIEDILKSAQWHQNLQKSLGISSVISEMLKNQNSITKSYSGISMMAEIAKSMHHQGMYTNSTMSAFEAMSNSLNLQSKFAIPQTTLDAITSINRQHEQLIVGIRAITEANKNQSLAIAQVNNLHFALSGISSQIAAIAAQQKEWSIIDDFEQVTEQSIKFSETLTYENTEEQQRQYQVLIDLILAFINKHKKKGKHAIRFLEVILVFHALFGICFPKPESATKEDIEQTRIKQDTILNYINLVNEKLKEAKEYRLTNRICEVKLKPKSKTLILTKLPKDYEVIVIQIQHKWVYVSFFDPKDNRPQTGWILKKYLEKPV